MVGIGFRPGTDARQVIDAVRQVADRPRIRCLATIDRRAAETGFRAAVDRFGVPLWSFTPAELSAVDVPHPDARTLAATGTAGVAEAAAVLAARHYWTDARILVPKSVFGGVTVAVVAQWEPPTGVGRIGTR
ncbi:MAG: cobalamin biosynthesis protein [Nocardia sp.]|nr:cobalamin biosynthesis protein [Nocardia sp.]